jgi:hypothetical protein
MNNTELAIMNRIALLRSRGTENGNIIKKLERKLRALKK